MSHNLFLNIFRIHGDRVLYKPFSVSPPPLSTINLEIESIIFFPIFFFFFLLIKSFSCIQQSKKLMRNSMRLYSNKKWFCKWQKKNSMTVKLFFSLLPFTNIWNWFYCLEEFILDGEIDTIQILFRLVITINYGALLWDTWYLTKQLRSQQKYLVKMSNDFDALHMTNINISYHISIS